jgi:hypothetical protein
MEVFEDNEEAVSKLQREREMKAKLELNPDGKSGVLIFDEEFYRAVETSYLRMQNGFRTLYGRDGTLEELTEYAAQTGDYDPIYEPVIKSYREAMRDKLQ